MKQLNFTVLALFLCIQVYAQEGDRVDVNGVKIYYEMHGEGTPLVLLHGFTMSHHMWKENGWIEEFSNDYKLILIDLRGHGRSTNPSNEFSHRQSAKDIFALMDTLGIGQFKAVGFSSGGMTLTHMAVMDTSRIEAMILIGSTSHFPEQTRAIQRSLKYETLDKEWMNDMKRWHPGGEAQIKSLVSQFKNFADTYEDMNFTTPYLSSIKTPTLIIHGDRDPFFPVNIPVSSFESMPNSYLWILPNFGHSSISEKSIWADPFFKTVDQFFSGEWVE